MILIHKLRARQPLAAISKPNVGFHPSGVGGIDGRLPVVSVQVDDYTVYVTKELLENIYQTAQKLEASS